MGAHDPLSLVLFVGQLVDQSLRPCRDRDPRSSRHCPRRRQDGRIVGGILGNKGGVVARLQLYDSTLCFVCAHLHADRSGVAARNYDVHTILEKTILVPDPIGEEERKATSKIYDFKDLYDKDAAASQKVGGGGGGVEAAATTTSTTINMALRSKWTDPVCDELKIDDHELTFFLGDLNYRIDTEYSTDEVFYHCTSGNWTFLREKDQLNIERKRGQVFSGFSEGLLEFGPTYKYQPGTNDYDQRPDKKIRAPAWCDRVLWRSLHNSEAVRLASYRRSELLPSDHKPVSAYFFCDLKSIASERERTVYQDLLNAVDKFQNAAAPKCSLENRMLETGIVKVKF